MISVSERALPLQPIGGELPRAIGASVRVDTTAQGHGLVNHPLHYCIPERRRLWTPSNRCYDSRHVGATYTPMGMP
jgi:hypothetical protein